jgi:hypothetical protein
MSNLNLNVIEERFLFEQRAKFRAINRQETVFDGGLRRKADAFDVNEAEF